MLRASAPSPISECVDLFHVVVAANEAIERTGQPAWNLEVMDEPRSAAEETRARTVDDAQPRGCVGSNATSTTARGRTWPRSRSAGTPRRSCTEIPTISDPVGALEIVEDAHRQAKQAFPGVRCRVRYRSLALRERR